MTEHLNKKHISAIFLIYFSKVFDSFNHHYIQNVLELYGFGPSVLKWKNSLSQGVPKGHSIITYLFILNNKGIVFARREGRSKTFADDTSIYMVMKNNIWRKKHN